MSDPIVLSEPLGGSALSKAARAGELPQWFVPLPSSHQGWDAHARRVLDSSDARWFERLEPAIAPTGRAADRLRKTTGGRGLVITTGQQPGLFGGPLMTLAKALTARALADVLQETLGIPVAPVFWAATDDADFDEAARISVALDGGARELCLEQRAPAGTPMARVPMGPEVARLAELMREACGSAPNTSYLDRTLAAYRDGAMVGDAYVSVLREVLEPFEIAVFDVSHPSVAQASTGLMQRAAQRAEAVAAAIKQRNHEIESAGYRPQVDEVPGLSVVFVNEHGTKRRLTQDEARAFTPRDDAWLSSTVLLRPVLERALFPTAAYVGGPGEVAYFAQVSAVADALDVPRPLVVPRWSTTIVEPRIQKLLTKLDASMAELSDPHAVETRLARARVAPDIRSSLDALRADLASNLEALARANDGIVSSDVTDGVRRNIEHRLDRLERRIVAGAKRRETELMRDIGTARGALYPHGVRQERKLGWLPFLARNGPSLAHAMIDAARVHAQTLVETPAVTAPPAAARAR